MRLDALNHIACPKCKIRLSLDGKHEMEGEHVMDGQLVCANCKQGYSIINGVPNLLRRDVTMDDLMTGNAYSDFYSQMVSDISKGDEILYGKTDVQEYEDFQAKTLINSDELLRNKFFLDAGCGLARMAEILARRCKVVVAFDITPSVYKAFHVWKNLPNVHIVRGDLTSMPVIENHFEIVWCDGALPYVSDVSKAMTELLKARTSDGFFYSWCYGPKIASNELLGRLFHFTRLPISARYLVIRIVSWVLMLAATVVQWKNMIPRTKKYSESVLDYSLANKINHVTESQITDIVTSHASNAHCEIIAHPKGSIEFRIGSVIRKDKE